MPPIYGQTYTFTRGLYDATIGGHFRVNPTIEAGDFTLSQDGGPFVPLTNLPFLAFVGSDLVIFILTAAEMTCSYLTVRGIDQVGAEWTEFMEHLEPLPPTPVPVIPMAAAAMGGGGGSTSQILTTAQDYLLETGEGITLEASVPEMIDTLARLLPIFANVGMVYNTDASMLTPLGFFALPPTVLQLLSVHYFPRELEPAGVPWAQDTLDPAWRTRQGTPTRYTQELESTRYVRLHPSATTPGPMGAPPFQGIPDAPAPTNHLVTVFLEAPHVADLAPWGEDLVAYLLAAWEATREGVRQDTAQAQALQTLVGFLVGFIKDLHHAPGEELVETAWNMPLWMNLPLA